MGRSSPSPAARGVSGGPRPRSSCGPVRRVAIGDLDLELARKTAEELGGSVTAYELDVTSRESVARFLDSVEADVGPLDVLINNAGIMPLGAFLEESDASAASPARHQRPRRHLRDEGGAAADDRARARARRQSRLRGREGRLPSRGHLLRHQARSDRPVRSGARGAARHRYRDHLHPAGAREHGAWVGRRGRPCREEAGAGGGGGGDTRRPARASLRGVRACLHRHDQQGDDAAAAPRARGDQPLAEGRPDPRPARTAGSAPPTRSAPPGANRTRPTRASPSSWPERAGAHA